MLLLNQHYENLRIHCWYNQNHNKMQYHNLFIFKLFANVEELVSNIYIWLIFYKIVLFVTICWLALFAILCGTKSVHLCFDYFLDFWALTVFNFLSHLIACIGSVLLSSRSWAIGVISRSIIVWGESGVRAYSSATRLKSIRMSWLCHLWLKIYLLLNLLLVVLWSRWYLAASLVCRMFWAPVASRVSISVILLLQRSGVWILEWCNVVLVESRGSSDLTVASHP